VPEPVALSSRAAEELRRRIVSGGLAAGERLPTEATLMEELGVGRSTLREAVRVLEREGLVRVRQGSGTYVAQPDRASLLAAAFGLTEAAHITEVRRVLEPAIARMAALRRTPEQAREILRLARVREGLRASGEVGPLVEADLALHRAVAAATNNPVLSDLFDAFALVLARLVAAAIHDGGTDRSADLHDRLAQAVAVGDPDDAESAVHAILDEN
jgi:GntR family transcriptional repressor for pyruvate dehydrogenase complex